MADSIVVSIFAPLLSVKHVCRLAVKVVDAEHGLYDLGGLSPLQ